MEDNILSENTLNNNDVVKKSSLGQIDYSGFDELEMTANVFGDGTRIIPRIQIQYSKKYMLWCDNSTTANDYPNKLLELYNNCSLHHYICNLKALLITGAGLVLKDSGATNASKTQQFLDQLNSDGDNANMVLKKQALDLVLFGGHAEEIPFTKNYDKILEIRHLEVLKIRTARPDTYGQINGFFWAFAWTDTYRPSRAIYCPKFNAIKAAYNRDAYKKIMDDIQYNNVSPYDMETMKDFINTGSTINFYKEYTPNSYYYPLPDYVAVIPAIEIDIESDIYALSSLKNGMDSGVRINLIGDPDDPEFKRGIKNMLKNYTGSRKANKPWITISQTPETKPDMEAIGTTNSLAQKYKVINDSQQQKILSGHGINNPAMVGILVAGKLGNTTGVEIYQSYQIFHNYIIKPKKKILEDFWNTIMKYNGLAEVEIKDVDIFTPQNTQIPKGNEIVTDIV